MSILSILRYRATVKREQKNVQTGEITWVTKRDDLPCLLVDRKAQDEASDSQVQRPFDRTALLFAPLSASIKPGDRLVFTRPVIGTYLVKPNGRNAMTPTGPRHQEWNMEQVA